MSTKPRPSVPAPNPDRNPNLNPAPPRLPVLLSALLCAALTACQTPPPPQQVQATTTVAPLPDTIERRVVELKLTLPPSSKPGPTATLTSVVVSGNLAFVSGHISRAADGKLITGRVGEELTVAQGKDAARQCGLAILASLRQELGSLDRVRRVVKVLGMVNCPPGFKDQPQVVNGFSELMLDVFGRERGLGARSAVGVASLPSNVAVEVEAVFEIAP
ncbi:MAG: hypothetical protein B9S33_11170 [Pedosphaera sp. Tous-C6FEB]|nr:MAG: hypothetical protein B9S33_11170 [Pedosphaera sp. Tous-C6FEB]